MLKLAGDKKDGSGKQITVILDQLELTLLRTGSKPVLVTLNDLIPGLPYKCDMLITYTRDISATARALLESPDIKDIVDRAEAEKCAQPSSKKTTEFPG